MAASLLVFIALSFLPCAIALYQWRGLSPQYWSGAGLSAFSCCLQAAFVRLVDRNVLTLEHSVRFAIFGIPTCVVALILIKRGTTTSESNGKFSPSLGVLSPSLGLVIWLFLITLH
jgi:hypothetical protein